MRSTMVAEDADGSLRGWIVENDSAGCYVEEQIILFYPLASSSKSSASWESM